MLLYINNQSVNSDEYFDIFFNNKESKHDWLKNSMLVGMGPFVSDFLTNGSTDFLIEQNKVYECISKKLSSIYNMKVKHFFLSDRENNIIVKLPSELKTNEDAITTTVAPTNRIIPTTEKGKDIIGGFYNEKIPDNFQVFEFMNIEVPNIKDPYATADIKVGKFIINMQFIYNKRTGMLLTYLYNIKAIPEYGPNWDKEKDGEGIPNIPLLYKMLIPILDHMEISFDIKVE